MTSLTPKTTKVRADLGLAIATIACVAFVLIFLVDAGPLRWLNIAGAYCLLEAGILTSFLSLSIAIRRRKWVTVAITGLCLVCLLGIGFVIFPRNVDELEGDLRAMKMTSGSPQR